MTSKPDDLDAVRTIVDTLTPFDSDTQVRVIRWACEKLGVKSPQAPPRKKELGGDQDKDSTPSDDVGSGSVDIKTFITSKAPSSNNEFAACVAYFYQFEAKDSAQKSSIDGDDLQDACRLAGRERLTRPSQTLGNAHTAGLLDKADDRGSYSISTVGENLVAMTLPSDSSAGKRAQAAAGKKTAKSKKVSKKKVAKKKTSKKKANKKKGA